MDPNVGRIAVELERLNHTFKVAMDNVEKRDERLTKTLEALAENQRLICEQMAQLQAMYAGLMYGRKKEEQE